MSDLIDTTEMYLRTVFELEEEGIPPLRARIAQRLGQSGPTVSQTVARMQRDGLLTVEGDRHLQLSPAGRAMATRVMRKHRLAECLLVQVIGLDWADVHVEACRWEHVISETVERRLLELLGHPTESPYGNPIPGLDELEHGAAGAGRSVPASGPLVPLDRVAGPEVVRVTVRRIGEPVQVDSATMAALRRSGASPGSTVKVRATAAGVLVGSGGEYVELDTAFASHIFVDAAGVGDDRHRVDAAGVGEEADVPSRAADLAADGHAGVPDGQVRGAARGRAEEG